MIRKAGLLLLLFGAGLLIGAAPAAGPGPRRTPKRAPTASPPLDFSGTWELDPKTSFNVSSRMERAVLEVSQKGDRIWISPGRKKMAVLAEEIVVDGRQYEKTLGNKERGLVAAAWAEDGKSLRLEITAGTPPKVAVQRSIWKLSADGTVWVRETHTVENGRARHSRLVFRKVDPAKARTPTPSEAGPKR